MKTLANPLRTAALALLLLAATGAIEPAIAGETVLFRGNYYRDAALSRVSRGMAEISSRRDGSAAVPISALPPKMKAEAEAIQKRKDEREAASAAIGGAPRERTPGEIQTLVRVVQVLPEGLLAARTDGQIILLQDHPDAGKVADGESISFRGRPEGVFKYLTALNVEATARVYRVISRQ